MGGEGGGREGEGKMGWGGREGGGAGGGREGEMRQERQAVRCTVKGQRGVRNTGKEKLVNS